jgi:hypothetical protein
LSRQFALLNGINTKSRERKRKMEGKKEKKEGGKKRKKEKSPNLLVQIFRVLHVLCDFIFDRVFWRRIIHYINALLHI